MEQSERVDERLVAELVAVQFPAWSSLPVAAVRQQGWDNRTFRLGEDLVVRLPTTGRVELQVDREVEALGVVAAAVSVEVPRVVATGRPAPGYPYRWTVLEWLDGVPLQQEGRIDRRLLAADLATFLRELRALPAASGRPHEAGLGRPVRQWAQQVAAAVERLGDRIDAGRARSVWDAACRADDPEDVRWFHGDVAPGNLLVRDGRLSGVIDFGAVGVGDPSCDLAFAWMHLEADAREAFRRELRPTDAEWLRGAGWALWFGLTRAGDPEDGVVARRVLAALNVAG